MNNAKSKSVVLTIKPERLEAAMKAGKSPLNWTDLSLLTGLSRTTLAKVQAGKAVRGQTIMTIAEVLNVFPAWLTGEYNANGADIPKYTEYATLEGEPLYLESL